MRRQQGRQAIWLIGLISSLRIIRRRENAKVWVAAINGIDPLQPLAGRRTDPRTE